MFTRPRPIRLGDRVRATSFPGVVVGVHDKDVTVRTVGAYLIGPAAGLRPVRKLRLPWQR